MNIVAMFSCSFILVTLLVHDGWGLLNHHQPIKCMECHDARSLSECRNVQCRLRQNSCSIQIHGSVINARCTHNCQYQHSFNGAGCEQCCHDADYCNRDLCKQPGVATCRYCASVLGFHTCSILQRCKPEQGCFLQRFESNLGQTYYHAGCTDEKNCQMVNIQSFGQIPNQDVLKQGMCCNKTTCNDPSLLPPPASTRRCEECSGESCGGPSLVNCPADAPLCLTEVTNSQDGLKMYTKTCATEKLCDDKWLKETALRPECVGFHQDVSYNYTFSCTFCCTTDGCNRDNVPSVDSLYLKA